MKDKIVILKIKASSNLSFALSVKLSGEKDEKCEYLKNIFEQYIILEQKTMLISLKYVNVCNSMLKVMKLQNEILVRNIFSIFRITCLRHSSTRINTMKSLLVFININIVKVFLNSKQADFFSFYVFFI